MKDIKNSFYKLTKKQVEDFDKKYKGNIEKNFLLKGRKWKLIGDTYYSIPPKLFSIGWFKELSKTYKVVTCCLLGGAVTTAVAVPTVIAIENSKNKHIVKDIEYCSWKYGTYNIKGDFFSKNPYVLYIPIMEYNDYIYESTMRVMEKDDDHVDLKNLTSIDPSKKAHLNLKTGELTYDSYSYFNSSAASGATYPHEEINFQGRSKRIDEECKYTEGTTYTINLSDYNLQPIKDGDTYYIPLDVIMKLDPTLPPCTAYYDGKSRVMVVSSTLPYVLDKVYSYPTSFYQYCYDIFTFDIDLQYGLNGYRRYQRNNDTYFTYNKEGARKTFESYKNKLVNSKSLEEFDTTFSKMICEQLDDGGHTGIYYASFASDTSKLPSDFAHAKENDYTGKKLSLEEAARDKTATERKDEHIKDDVIGFDTDGNNKADIGYLYFTGFDNSGLAALEKANAEFNPEVNAASEIQDVVIDIANNGGGAVALEGMVLSWICGGKAKQILRDSKDGSVTQSVYQYDIDGNGACGEEKDYLPSGVNIYILTDASFSAGAQLPFDTYMYRESSECKNAGKNITFIGQPNLGGSCSVTNPIISPTGFEYRLSSSAVGVFWDDYSKNCDELIPVDEGWELSLDEIMHRIGTDGINAKIVEARK